MKSYYLFHPVGSSGSHLSIENKPGIPQGHMSEPGRADMALSRQLGDKKGMELATQIAVESLCPEERAPFRRIVSVELEKVSDQRE